MEKGSPAAPPRSSGARRYKAVVPWRFQPDFVRKQVMPSATTPSGSGVGRLMGAQRRGAAIGGGGESGESKRCTRSLSAKASTALSIENGGCSGSGDNGDSGDGSGGGVGTAAGEDCTVVRSNCQPQRCTRSSSAKGSNVQSVEKGDLGGSADLGNGKGDGVSMAAGEDCNSLRSNCQSQRRKRSCSAKGFDVQSEEKGGHRGNGNNGGLGNGGGGGVGTSPGEDRSMRRSNRNCVTLGADVQPLVSVGSIGSSDGTVYNTEWIGRNAGGGECSFEGSEKPSVNENQSKNNGSSTIDCMPRGTDGNVNSTHDGAAKESNAEVKGCHTAGPGNNGNEKYCRRGRKAVLPWRFQVGYKRSFSKAFCYNKESSGAFGIPSCSAQVSSTQCTPATRSTVRCYASAHSGVRVSAMLDLSSVKSEKETSTACKKRKTNNDESNQAMPVKGVDLVRENMMGSLQDFRLIYSELLDEEDMKMEVRPDLQAYRIFRERFFKECDDKKYVGSVPGIHVGDIFHLRVELCVVGLHRPHRVGVDYIKEEDGTCVAVSIVSYAQSSDFKDNLDVLVYFGSKVAIGNQKIEGTNLALKKSMDTNTPVRVIHGFVTNSNGNCRGKKVPTYIYGGLYTVEKYSRVKQSDDRHVYKFRLRRIAGQKHIDIQEILESRKVGSHDRIIMKDISHGLEKIPISVVNSISDERPMPYCYMSCLRYPRNYRPAPPAGCECVGGCSYSKKCACSVKNGGEIPFNDKGRIVEAKPLVYECGPSCKCPPTCYNRVGQHGMKFRLQIFKTKSMGWGVRTLDFIPSGSFVCEYIGEVLTDEEAQKRKTDEYLFAIGHNYYDETLWEGLSRSIPSLQKSPAEDEEAGFAIDASKMGNFVKFINHCCTPNLYAQNVLYDHDDKSVPRIMFFACEDIPPHQELAYHYNYTIDQVHDANGNIKKKKCLCGSIECDGWLY